MISIVVPVYNVRPYLGQCMESIMSQTFADLEIIVVDDGSTDGSGSMCDDYASQDTRIRVIHKTNGGLSDARNAGVKAAGGEWIYFADSDDWIAPQAVETLHTFAVAHECDAVQGNLYYAYADRLLFRKADRRERRQRVLSRDEAMRALIINDRVKNFAWGKLYKRELICDLEFPAGRFFEDSFWQHLAMDRTTRYGIVDEPLYYYRQRPDSISGTSSDRLKDLLEGYACRLEFVRERYPQYYGLMRKMYEKTKRRIEAAGERSSLLRRLPERVLNRLRSINRYETVRLR